MAWLFRLLDRTARPLPLGILLVALVALRQPMQATIARLRTVSGEGIPDYEVLYSRERLLEIFIAYGEAGAVLYRRFLAYDLVFPLLYSTLFASLIHIGLRRTRFRLLAAAPFAMALFDYVEDGLFFSLLTLHPELPQRLVGAANVMTLGKFGCGGLSAVAGLAAGAALLRNRLRPR